MYKHSFLLVLLALSCVGIAQTPFAPAFDDCDYGYSTIMDFYGDDIAVSGVSLAEGHHIVYMFNKASGTIEQLAAINPEGIQYASSGFGQYVSLGENMLAVGAWIYGNSGAVNIYRKTDGNWNFIQQLIPDDLTDDSAFGFRLKIYDKYLVIGAPNDRPEGSENATQGSVYVYTFSGNQWVFLQKLFIPGTSYFGLDLDMNQDKIVVRNYSPPFDHIHTYLLNDGIWEYDGTNTNFGVCRFSGAKLFSGFSFFSYTDHHWVEDSDQAITLSPPPFGPGMEEFEGYSWSGIEVIGNDFFMGAVSYMVPGPRKFPLLHYRKSGNTWNYVGAIYSPLPLTSADQFGAFLKSSGNTLLIAAPGEGSQLPYPHGLAYLLDMQSLGNASPDPVAFSVYPNPVNNQVHIESPIYPITGISIYSVTGQLIGAQATNTDSIEVGNLSAGVYFLKVTFANGYEKMTRIVKE